MDVQDILALYDQQQRIDIEYPGVRKDASPQLVRFVRPAPGMSSRLIVQHAAYMDYSP